MARKNGLKKLLMYVVVIISSLFVGFLAYFFAKNDEVIALTIEPGSIIYLNAGNTEALPLLHTKPSKFTKITVTSSNEEVATYIEGTKRLYARAGGTTTITITTTNKDFGPYNFNISVGDGSSDNPWYISTSRQFSKIGTGLQEITGENFLSSHSYELIGDIDLGNLYTEDEFWQPIETFEGSLQGEGHNVLNLKINAENIDNVGLFGTLTSSAVVENINFVNAEINATNAKNVGIIAGINEGSIGKVRLNGSIVSSGATAYVGGVVGRNTYVGSRPTINMVEAKVSFKTDSTTGGLVGLNKAGIVFNSAIQVLDLNVNTDKEDIVTTFAFGGLVGRNEAGVYGENNLRQAAVKNSFVKFVKLSVLDENNAYITKVGKVAFQNVNGSIGHPYYIPNNYASIVVLANTPHALTELGNGQNIATKTDVGTYDNPSFIEVTKVEDFGLTSIWSIDRIGRFLTLDMEESYENPSVSDPGSQITSKQGIVDAINKIYTTTSPITYSINLEDEEFEDDIEKVGEENVLVIYGHEITGEIVDTDWTIWTPIHSSSIGGYNGQIVVHGGRVVIKNLIIDEGFEIGFQTKVGDSFTTVINTYYGLFSNITGKNTIVKNLGVENVKITAQVAQKQYAGGFAGAITDAFAENITVENVEITNAENAGFVFGAVNNATVKNVVVGSFERLEEELINATEDDEYSYNNPPNRINITNAFTHNVNLGGFAGVVSSSVNDITVHYGIIKFQGTKEARIGGFAGTINESNTIKNIRINYGVSMTSLQIGKGYFGGVAGYVLPKSIIEYSFSLATISIIPGVQEESHAGGIAGYLASEAIIRNSFAGDQSSGEISGKNVGGIVSINHGSIYQSQVAGVYNGHNVGGIAFKNYGRIESVLVTATLHGTGTSNSYTVAGIAGYMEEGSVTKYIISTASISGNGKTKLYAETRSYVNYSGFETILNGITSGKIFNGTHKVGQLDNYIVVGYGSAERQRGIMGKASFWLSVLESSEDELMLQGGSNPYIDAGFMDLNNFIWRFEAGEFPRLINIAENPFVVVEDDAF